ncbi:hypothetical protein EJ03DRAFT_266807 [Teratosphaeria nubilosa]|uniref:Asl1-like glycosyl hydrolase catalytic domain-containing protein n=1 Tax=Teratosphaeria nubilosa TaxID=161662 RepID=A0A6G1LIN3_9PEZI|nr:hypothetical protein EJ03DRAFT_266807 [Teratosphaeria nubilosa]
MQQSQQIITAPGSSKRGLCWPTDNHGKDEVFTFTKPGSKINWLYNWSPSPTPNASSLHFVPMQWNHVGMDDLPAKAKAANATHILGFNEPELPDQSNVSVELAAREWLRVVEPMRRAGLRAGSPGISSAPQGVVWLKEFIDRIRQEGSDVDFYCFHWYGVDLGGFYDYIWSTYYQMPDQQRPVWITEFAPTNWNPDNPLPREHVEAFMRDSIKYLDKEVPWVERYAWFGPMRDCGTVGKWARLLDEDGKLTELGKMYTDS